jgi:phosphoribosylaminoimidazolecarboxamide formyltransferase/IMP cyclohydrolase
MIKIGRALLSVSDKREIVELAKTLSSFDVELISSGGTARLLAESGIAVTEVSDFTGAKEMLDGRVKTLHPRVFGGILARTTPEHLAQVEEHDLKLIDLVVVNLYPFEKTIADPATTMPQAIEQIDIGGPSLIRAAAKNSERVAVVVDPGQYGELVSELQANEGQLSSETCRRLAADAFGYTAAYDAAISNYFAERESADQQSPFPASLAFACERVQPLRYGENPHQSASFYRSKSTTGGQAPLFEQLQGKALSYNNLIDVDAAWSLTQDMPDAAICIIKHTNPCGAASVAGNDLAEAFKRALACDPVSAFGSIVGCNHSVSPALAQEIKNLFVEVVVAPDFDAEALELLSKKKKLRLVRAPRLGAQRIMRSALGGLLVQDQDTLLDDMREAKVVTERKPDATELAELQFAWALCKHVKSNAIVFTRDRQLVGVGAGQMSRVDSVKIAARRAVLPIDGGVAASDAFFPFRDGLDHCADAGVKAIVQPGGSVRDKEVIAAANERGLAMVFTGNRHFKH